MPMATAGKPWCWDWSLQCCILTSSSCKRIFIAPFLFHSGFWLAVSLVGKVAFSLFFKETGNKGFAYRCQHMLLSSSAHLTCTVQPLQFRLCTDPWRPKPIKANRQVWGDKFSARFLLSLSSLSAALHTQLTTLSLALHLCCSLPFPLTSTVHASSLSPCPCEPFRC